MYVMAVSAVDAIFFILFSSLCLLLDLDGLLEMISKKAIQFYSFFLNLQEKKVKNVFCENTLWFFFFYSFIRLFKNLIFFSILIYSMSAQRIVMVGGGGEGEGEGEGLSVPIHKSSHDGTRLMYLLSSSL